MVMTSRVDASVGPKLACDKNRYASGSLRPAAAAMGPMAQATVRTHAAERFFVGIKVFMVWEGVKADTGGL